METKVIYGGESEGGLGEVACALGVFDGVHCGHRKLIGDCIARAGELGIRSLVLTFDRDPEEVLTTRSARKLLSNADRLAMLASLGADYVLVQRFDEAFAHMAPEEFVQRTMLSEMDPRAVFVGSDFRFGHKASGDVALLAREVEGVCTGDVLRLTGPEFLDDIDYPPVLRVGVLEVRRDGDTVLLLVRDFMDVINEEYARIYSSAEE